MYFSMYRYCARINNYFIINHKMLETRIKVRRLQNTPRKGLILLTLNVFKELIQGSLILELQRKTTESQKRFWITPFIISPKIKNKWGERCKCISNNIFSVQRSLKSLRTFKEYDVGDNWTLFFQMPLSVIVEFN